MQMCEDAEITSTLPGKVTVFVVVWRKMLQWQILLLFCLRF